MPITTRRLTALVACGATALVLAACGGGEQAGDDARAGTGAARIGGTATVNLTSFPDYLDPALSYTVEGWQAMWNVYTPLITYRHAEGPAGSVLVPGLAERLPEISPDGRTYRLQLREGLEYSDGTPVEASDFEHSIKRVLRLESGGAPFFMGIEGAEEYLRSRRAGDDIRGIVADDRTGAITIRLRKPDGAFTNVLASNFAGLVPGDTPFENRTKTPPPGVGPFALADVRTGRSFALQKVGGFDVDGLPEARLDRIQVDVDRDQRRQVRNVMRNRVDYIVDPPPADQLREVRGRYRDRFEEYATNSTYFYFLNHDVAPFDDRRARQAVNHAVDKRALARLFHGMLEPSCNFLPPGVQGYRRIEDCPYGDPTQAPDVERARRLVREAGLEGTEVTVYGHDEDPPRPVTEYLADVLNAIGFRAKARIVEASEYGATIGSHATGAQAGFLNWFQDFPHPANFMFLVSGDTIQPRHNQNPGNIDDPDLDALIDRAGRSPRLADAADLYAQADRRIVEQAHVVPYGHRKLANFTSERVDFERCTVTHPLYQLDLASLCLR